MARFLCTIETAPSRRRSTSEGTVRLGAVCAEQLKRRARRRAQFSPRTQHAFTQHEWRVHHPQQTRFGITRARNKVRFCFSALGLAAHESCLQDRQHGAGSQNESCTVLSIRVNRQHGAGFTCLGPAGLVVFCTHRINTSPDLEHREREILHSW